MKIFVMFFLIPIIKILKLDILKNVLTETENMYTFVFFLIYNTGKLLIQYTYLV